MKTPHWKRKSYIASVFRSDILRWSRKPLKDIASTPHQAPRSICCKITSGALSLYLDCSLYFVYWRTVLFRLEEQHGWKHGLQNMKDDQMNFIAFLSRHCRIPLDNVAMIRTLSLTRSQLDKFASQPNHSLEPIYFYRKSYSCSTVLNGSFCLFPVDPVLIIRHYCRTSPGAEISRLVTLNVLYAMLYRSNRFYGISSILSLLRLLCVPYGVISCNIHKYITNTTDLAGEGLSCLLYTSPSPRD